MRGLDCCKCRFLLAFMVNRKLTSHTLLDIILIELGGVPMADRNSYVQKNNIMSQNKYRVLGLALLGAASFSIVGVTTSNPAYADECLLDTSGNGLATTGADSTEAADASGGP